MSKKHTPGPWKVFDESLVVGPHDGTTDNIASVRSRSDGSRIANSRLIAAAPEMHEALSLYVSAGVGNSTDFATQSLAHEKAIYALAKARQL